MPKSGDENRVFGVPTIRTDIKRNGVKSVADPQVLYKQKQKIRIMEMKNQQLQFFSLKNILIWDWMKVSLGESEVKKK